MEQKVNNITYTSHEQKMAELKEFLELSGIYFQKLMNGKNIDDMFDDLAKEHDLKSISKKGTYHFACDCEILDEKRCLLWNKKIIENKLYAMAYAYAKYKKTNNFIENPDTPIIRKTIQQMKKR